MNTFKEGKKQRSKMGRIFPSYIFASSNSNKSGFTLIELLIVVAIIALLSGIVLTSFNPAKAKSRDAKRISDLNQLQLAMELAFDRCRLYPTVLNTTTTICTSSGTTINLGVFISTIPTFPAGPGITQTQYEYAVNGTRTDYNLHATLEATNDVVRDGVSPAIAGASFTCSNTAGSVNYCVGPK